MNKSILILTAFSVSAFFVSCKKDSNSAPGNIQGKWSFQSMDVQSLSSVEYTENGNNYKTISTSNYSTQHNSGTIVIDASTFKSSNISYSVNTVFHADHYTNDVLGNSSDIPVIFTPTTSNSTATYKFIGTDSVHFEGGSILVNGINADIQSSGAKISLEGDILYMTQNVNITQTQNMGGVLMTNTISAKTIAKLQKQ